MSKGMKMIVWRCSAALLVAGALTILGCSGERPSPGWEYMPDMVHSVAYDSFAPNTVTPQGMTLRRPVEGTVPRGFQPFPYGPGPEEAARAGRELHNPFDATPVTLARAETLYRTFCQPCHGAAGQGDGPVAAKFPPPPSYTGTGTRDLPAGRIYHVITHGSGRMPSYASQIAPDDRWRVVLWVQKLQKGSDPPATSQARAEGTNPRPEESS